jgi:hypothetical protein
MESFPLTEKAKGLEESRAFPGPSQEIAIPVRIRVILLLDAGGRILKAIRDKTVNRNWVMAELEESEKKKAAQWKALLGDDPKAALEALRKLDGRVGEGMSKNEVLAIFPPGSLVEGKDPSSE